MKRRILLASALALAPAPLLAKDDEDKRFLDGESFVKQYLLDLMAVGPATGVYLPIAYVNANDVYEDQLLYVSWYMATPPPGYPPRPNPVTAAVHSDYVLGTPQANGYVEQTVTCYAGYYYVPFQPKSVAANTLITVRARESLSSGSALYKYDDVTILNR